MKIPIIIYLFAFSVISLTSLYAQDTVKVKNQKENSEQTKENIKHGQKFVDKDGDGFNDNAPDHDGDGIPNGLDPDYKGKGKKKFVDLDGDGINDNVEGQVNQKNKRGFGPKGKSGSQGTSPQNGAGKQKGKGKKSGN